MERIVAPLKHTERDNYPPVLATKATLPPPLGIQIMRVRLVGLIDTLLEAGNSFEGFPPSGFLQRLLSHRCPPILAHHNREEERWWNLKALRPVLPPPHPSLRGP